MVAARVELMWIGELAPAVAVAGLKSGLEHGAGVQVCELEAERAHWRGRGWWSEGGLEPRAHLLVRVIDLPQIQLRVNPLSLQTSGPIMFKFDPKVQTKLT